MLFSLHCLDSTSEVIYSGPCILRPAIKLEVVLKWRDISDENRRTVSLLAGFKMEGS